ncbi:hypothetical protein QN277_018926 [Acacia crassicarpa]|uniref:Uncharacterized protein n=1 Tax=Acacia crassicarpa TaxID=499986 RepID=A0AAE1JSS6_9FABA|nr:hypothetical protein QN277_018926 [Acacia crassicarpa]
MDDTGSNFTQLRDIDEDSTDCIDFSDETEYDMPHEMEEHLQNDLINSMPNENVEQIPLHFILRRCCKDGNNVLSKDKELSLFNGDGLVHSLHLSSKCQRLIELAQRSDEAFKFIYDGLDALTTSTEKFPTYGESTQLEDIDVQHLNSQLEESSMMNLKDPNMSQTKGRKRIRSGIEEASKQTNICEHCKKRGHNKRSCKEINMH